jgi:P4 family phage/plasmid primase-like protien
MKEFTKHVECIEYCKHNGLAWFQKDINDHFSKLHLATTYDEIFERIVSGETNYYESITQHKPIKFFIDYDKKVFDDEDNNKDKETNMVTHKNDILNIINTVTNIIPGIKDTYILKSIPDNEKKSYHIIFDGIHFPNYTVVKKFVEDTLMPRFKQLFDSKIIDTKVYRQGCFRSLLCSKFGQKRPLYLLNTSTFLADLQEDVIEDITVDLFKKTCVTYINTESVLYNYKSETKKNSQNKKLHLINDGDIYSDKEIIRKYLDILDPDRYNDRNKWLNIGYILYSISPDNDDLWHYFSSKWEHYNKSECVATWNSFSNCEYIYTIHSLMYLAEIDNVEEFNEVAHEIPNHDIKFLRPFDNIISKLIYRLYGEKFVCSNPEKNEWYFFNGIRWERENKSYNLRKLMINDVFNRLEQYRRTLIKENANEELIKNYHNILMILGSGRKLQCLELEFYNHNFYKIIDQNKDLIGFENGLFDLTSMEFRKGNPSDYVSMSTGYEYKEYTTETPEYREVMDLVCKILPREDVRHFTLKSLASCLDGHIRDENFYIWSGKNASGGNGKSTIMDLLLKSLGDYGYTAPVSLVTAKRESASSANSALANLKNKRAVIMQEPEYTEKIQVGVMKALTGGDRISTRDLHSSQVEFKPHAKLFMACNKIPSLSDIDGGVMRRLKITEFTSRFVDNPTAMSLDEEKSGVHEFKLDKNLKSKLDDYKIIFMSVLLNYYRIYRQDGLTPPHPVVEITKKYELDNNIIKQFVDENIVSGDRTAFITLQEIKDKFKSDSIMKSHFGNFSNFKKQLELTLCTEFRLDNKKQIHRVQGYRIKGPEIEESEDELL